MTQEIEIVCCKPGDHSQELSLYYKPLSKPIAQKYFNALKECETKGYGIIDPERFHRFPGYEKQREWIVQELNRCIDIINAYKPGTIDKRAAVDMSQEHFNDLHHYFEQLRGFMLKPSEFFTKAPQQVQLALETYNLMIHRYEDFSRYLQNQRDWENSRDLVKRIEKLFLEKMPLSAHAILTFDYARPRYPLADEDYRYFSRLTPFGSLLINYCELGKPLIDFFQDKDEVIGDENIRPLRYYSADALLQFWHMPSPPRAFKKHRDFKVWWNQHEKELLALGFKKNDPKNAIGHIAVARLNRRKGAIAGLKSWQIVELISQYQHFKSVHCRGAVEQTLPAEPDGARSQPVSKAA